MSDKILSEEKIKEVEDNFKFFDSDNNGFIDEKEFEQLMKIIEPRARTEEIEKGFNIVDEDGDGFIDFAEFLQWWKQCWWQF